MQRNTLFDHVLIVLRTIMIFVVVLHLKSNFALIDRTVSGFPWDGASFSSSPALFSPPSWLNIIDGCLNWTMTMKMISKLKIRLIRHLFIV